MLLLVCSLHESFVTFSDLVNQEKYGGRHGIRYTSILSVKLLN